MGNWKPKGDTLQQFWVATSQWFVGKNQTLPESHMFKDIIETLFPFLNSDSLHVFLTILPPHENL